MSETRRRVGLPPPGLRPFTADEDALLGTMVDRMVAERTGRDYKTVAARRKKLGIPSFREVNGCGACRGGERPVAATGGRDMLTGGRDRQTGAGLLIRPVRAPFG